MSGSCGCEIDVRIENQSLLRCKRAKSVNNDAERIKDLLKKVSDRYGETSNPVLQTQLKKITAELKLVIDNPDYVPYYPNMIVDSWKQDDELGAELLNFAYDLDKGKHP